MEQSGRKSCAQYRTVSIGVVKKSFYRASREQRDSNRMLGDKQQYFSDKDNVKVFFLPIPVSIWKKLERESQRELMTQRRKMLGECKKRRIKNIVTEILHKNQSNRKQKSFGKVAVDNDPYETIASRYESILRVEEETNDNITFRKVAVVMDEIEQDQEKVTEDGLQASPVIQSKLEYFCLYSFMISFVATDR